MAKASNMAFRVETVNLSLCINCLEKLTHRTVTRYRFRLFQFNQKYIPVLFSEYSFYVSQTFSVLLHKISLRPGTFKLTKPRISCLLHILKGHISSTLVRNDPTCCCFALLWQTTLSLTQWVCSYIHSQSKAQTS